MRAAYIIAARRTAIARAGGIYRTRRYEQLAAPVLKTVLADAKLDPDQLDEVILGNALEGGNPARVAALAAGLSPALPALTVDRQCASGLDAIVEACRRVALGNADAVVAGGVESVSTAPWRVARPGSHGGPPQFMTRARFSAEPHSDPDMIPAAEAVARLCGISRSDQDRYAARSHANALSAAEGGLFAGEIVPVFAASAAERDECPRKNFTATRLARFKPLTGDGGTVTAATCAPEADAAAAVVVVCEKLAALGSAPNALRFIDAAASGGDPAYPGLAAVPALARLQQRLQWSDWSRVQQVEFNEAFAGQALACQRRAGLPAARICPHGGALAFGHPYGASGAILVVRLFHDMLRSAEGAVSKYALASLSAAGGQGSAALFMTASAGSY